MYLYMYVALSNGSSQIDQTLPVYFGTLAVSLWATLGTRLDAEQSKSQLQRIQAPQRAISTLQHHRTIKSRSSTRWQKRQRCPIRQQDRRGRLQSNLRADHERWLPTHRTATISHDAT